MDSSDKKTPEPIEHVEQTSMTGISKAELAARQIAYERSLTFWQTVRIFWRSTLWILYGQLVVFGYGIDGVIAGYLLGIPRFRYLQVDLPQPIEPPLSASAE